jgi:hypothetical protein
MGTADAGKRFLDVRAVSFLAGCAIENATCEDWLFLLSRLRI